MRRACKNCKLVTEKNNCSQCSSPTTQRWSGYLGLSNPENSEIAKIMKIKVPGEYALKVR